MKKDIKYIIKRVLIIVLSSIIIFSLKKCNVYADTLYFRDRSFASSNPPSFVNEIPTPSEYYLNFGVFPLDKNNDLNIYFNSPGFSPPDISNYLYFYNRNTNTSIYWSNANVGVICSEYNKIEINLNDNYPIKEYCSNSDSISSIKWNEGTQHVIIFSSDSNYIDTLFNDLDYNTSNSEISLYNYNDNLYYYTSFSNGSITNGDVLNNFINSNYFIDFELYNTNYDDVFINNNKIPINNNIVPGFSEIDITNYQAVYFVPKNYENIPIESAYDHIWYDFKYYYIGSYNDGFFDLSNTNHLYVANYDLFNFSRTFLDTKFPYYVNYDNDVTSDYWSFIIYNKEKDSSIKRLIWYDSDLFDYYLIDNFDTYNQNVCFDNGEESNICYDIKFDKTVVDLFGEGFDAGGNKFGDIIDNKNSSVYLFLDLLKLPFDFLNRLNKGTCSPISLPIPFIDSSISLPCMSTIFSNVLGSFYAILQTLLSALIIYRVMIINVKCLIDVLKPTTGKLEVVDL